jgi:hypothetical protein
MWAESSGVEATCKVSDIEVDFEDRISWKGRVGDA